MDAAQMYSMYFEAITRYAREISGAACAEDIAQETFLRAMRSVDVLRGLKDAQARSWLYTTARHVAIDMARREHPVEMPRNDAFFDDLTWVEVESVLGKLDPDERRLVLLRHYQGKTSEEIGQILSLPATTVRTRLRATRKKLRTLYEKTEQLGGKKHGKDENSY